MATAGSDLQDIEAVEHMEIEDQYINFYEGNSLAITESLAASPPTDLNPNNEQNSDETISASSLHTNAHTNALSNTVHDERRVATQTQAEINNLNGQMQLDLHEPVLPLWLSQSLHQQAQARLSQTQQIVVSEPSSLALNVIPPPSIEHLLQQEFPDNWSEAIALRQAQLKSLNGYIAFRNFHMLYTISKALGFDLFTNYSDGVVKSLEGQDITISHIYSWLGINHRTFANKRAKLHHVYQSLQLLQHIMDRGLASPRLMELHSQCIHFNGITVLIQLETGSWNEGTRGQEEDDYHIERPNLRRYGCRTRIHLYTQLSPILKESQFGLNVKTDSLQIFAKALKKYFQHDAHQRPGWIKFLEKSKAKFTNSEWVDVVPPILYLRLLFLAETGSLLALGQYNSSLKAKDLPGSLRSIVRWLGRTMSLLKKSNINNILLNISFVVFNITMLQLGVICYVTDWKKFKYQVQSSGQSIEDNWETDYNANEWQFALLLAIATSPLLLLRKSLLKSSVSRQHIIKLALQFHISRPQSVHKVEALLWKKLFECAAGEKDIEAMLQEFFAETNLGSVSVEDKRFFCFEGINLSEEDQKWVNDVLEPQTPYASQPKSANKNLSKEDQRWVDDVLEPQNQAISNLACSITNAVASAAASYTQRRIATRPKNTIKNKANTSLPRLIATSSSKALPIVDYESESDANDSQQKLLHSSDSDSDSDVPLASRIRSADFIPSYDNSNRDEGRAVEQVVKENNMNLDVHEEDMVEKQAPRDRVQNSVPEKMVVVEVQLEKAAQNQNQINKERLEKAQEHDITETEETIAQAEQKEIDHEGEMEQAEGKEITNTISRHESSQNVVAEGTNQMSGVGSESGLSKEDQDSMEVDAEDNKDNNPSERSANKRKLSFDAPVPEPRRSSRMKSDNQTSQYTGSTSTPYRRHGKEKDATAKVDGRAEGKELQPEHNAVEIIEYDKWISKEYPAACRQAIFSSRCILIRNTPHMDYNFKDKGDMECLLGDEAVYQTRILQEGTLEDMIDVAAIDVRQKILNCLEITLPFTKAPFSQDLATQAEAEGYTGGRLNLDGLFWAIAGHKGAYSLLHIDANGMATIVEPRTGKKYWVIAKPKKDEQKASVDLIKELTVDFQKATKNWDFYAVILQPGDIFIMQPATPQYVMTLEDSVCFGSHCYSSQTLSATSFGIFHALTTGDLLTNTSHPNALEGLVRIAKWWHTSICETPAIFFKALGKAGPQVKINGSHIIPHKPNFHLLEDVIGFLNLANLVTLAPVLDARHYTEVSSPEEGLWGPGEYIRDDILRMYKDGRKLVSEIKEWLFSHFEMHLQGGNQTDDGLTDNSRLKILSQRHFFQQCVALVVHRSEAEKADIGGEVDGITAARIKSAIEDNLAEDAQFLEQWPNPKQLPSHKRLSYSFPKPPEGSQYVMVQVKGT
ncbi:hypothetical protein BT96DRAFT_982076 [Gymnopus androsaceus JB14]|uniref:JmjC domain-containing protein n=1 Tax=Gymnopus androsaceus JB14 TaxID=1447944 RepID=A0A6A4GIC4_9AGAR|nr:hypothetical protein BT96DRAFT_982076 [Gymnopus androsaceus JB14]